MGLQESDGDRHQDEQDKHDQQDPKMKQKDQLFFTLNQIGMSILKMAQLDTLGLSESTIKRKRKQLKETGLIKRQPGSGIKKIIDEEKECFILEHLAGNPFFKQNKDCYTPEGTVQGSWDLRNKHQKIFSSKMV